MNKRSSIIFNHGHIHSPHKEREILHKTRISKEPEERKQEIIQAALELFSEKGYANTTIQDISERINVSQGLCYRYFKSKSEIFAATSEYYAMQAVEQIKMPVDGDINAIDKLNIVLKRIFEYSMKNHEFEASFNEDSENTELRASKLDNVAEQMVAIMLPIVEQGVKEKLINCKDVPNTIRFLVYGLIHTFHMNIPVENTMEYMVYFMSFIKDVVVSVFKIENPDMVGQGWIEG